MEPSSHDSSSGSHLVRRDEHRYEFSDSDSSPEQPQRRRIWIQNHVMNDMPHFPSDSLSPTEGTPSAETHNVSAASRQLHTLPSPTSSETHRERSSTRDHEDVDQPAATEGAVPRQTTASHDETTNISMRPTATRPSSTGSAGSDPAPDLAYSTSSDADEKRVASDYEALSELMHVVLAALRRVMALPAVASDKDTDRSGLGDTEDDFIHRPRLTPTSRSTQAAASALAELEGAESRLAERATACVQRTCVVALRRLNAKQPTSALRYLLRGDGMTQPGAGAIVRLSPENAEVRGVMETSGVATGEEDEEGDSDLHLYGLQAHCESGISKTPRDALQSASSSLWEVKVPFYAPALEEARLKARASVLNNRGLYHFQMGEYSLAKQHLSEAVEIEESIKAPTIGITYFNLAQASWELANQHQQRQRASRKAGLGGRPDHDDSNSSGEACGGATPSSSSVDGGGRGRAREAATAAHRSDALHRVSQAAAAVERELHDHQATVARLERTCGLLQEELALAEGPGQALSEERAAQQGALAVEWEATKRSLTVRWARWRESICFLSQILAQNARWLREGRQQLHGAAHLYEQSIRWLSTVPNLTAQERARVDTLRRVLARCKRDARDAQLNRKLYGIGAASHAAGTGPRTPSVRPSSAAARPASASRTVSHSPVLTPGKSKTSPPPGRGVSMLRSIASKRRAQQQQAIHNPRHQIVTTLLPPHMTVVDPVRVVPDDVSSSAGQTSLRGSTAAHTNHATRDDKEDSGRKREPRSAHSTPYAPRSPAGPRHTARTSPSCAAATPPSPAQRSGSRHSAVPPTSTSSPSPLSVVQRFHQTSPYLPAPRPSTHTGGRRRTGPRPRYADAANTTAAPLSDLHETTDAGVDWHGSGHVETAHSPHPTFAYPYYYNPPSYRRGHSNRNTQKMSSQSTARPQQSADTPTRTPTTTRMAPPCVTNGTSCVHCEDEKKDSHTASLHGASHLNPGDREMCRYYYYWCEDCTDWHYHEAAVHSRTPTDTASHAGSSSDGTPQAHDDDEAEVKEAGTPESELSLADTSSHATSAPSTLQQEPHERQPSLSSASPSTPPAILVTRGAPADAQLGVPAPAPTDDNSTHTSETAHDNYKGSANSPEANRESTEPLSTPIAAAKQRARSGRPFRGVAAHDTAVTHAPPTTSSSSSSPSRVAVADAGAPSVLHCDASSTVGTSLTTTTTTTALTTGTHSSRSRTPPNGMPAINVILDEGILADLIRRIVSDEVIRRNPHFTVHTTTSSTTDDTPTTLLPLSSRPEERTESTSDGTPPYFRDPSPPPPLEAGWAGSVGTALVLDKNAAVMAPPEKTDMVTMTTTTLTTVPPGSTTASPCASTLTTMPPQSQEGGRMAEQVPHESPAAEAVTGKEAQSHVVAAQQVPTHDTNAATAPASFCHDRTHSDDATDVAAGYPHSRGATPPTTPLQSHRARADQARRPCASSGSTPMKQLPPSPVCRSVNLASSVVADDAPTTHDASQSAMEATPEASAICGADTLSGEARATDGLRAFVGEDEDEEAPTAAVVAQPPLRGSLSLHTANNSFNKSEEVAPPGTASEAGSLSDISQVDGDVSSVAMVLQRTSSGPSTFRDSEAARVSSTQTTIEENENLEEEEEETAATDPEAEWLTQSARDGIPAPTQETPPVELIWACAETPAQYVCEPKDLPPHPAATASATSSVNGAELSQTSAPPDTTGRPVPLPTEQSRTPHVSHAHTSARVAEHHPSDEEDDEAAADDVRVGLPPSPLSSPPRSVLAHTPPRTDEKTIESEVGTPCTLSSQASPTHQQGEAGERPPQDAESSKWTQRAVPSSHGTGSPTGAPCEWAETHSPWVPSKTSTVARTLLSETPPSPLFARDDTVAMLNTTQDDSADLDHPASGTPTEGAETHSPHNVEGRDGTMAPHRHIPPPPAIALSSSAPPRHSHASSVSSSLMASSVKGVFVFGSRKGARNKAKLRQYLACDQQSRRGSSPEATHTPPPPPPPWVANGDATVAGTRPPTPESDPLSEDRSYPGSEADSGFNEPFNPRRSSVPSRAEEPPMACSSAQPAAGSSGGECCAKQTEPTVLPGELAAASAHLPHVEPTHTSPPWVANGGAARASTRSFTPESDPLSEDRSYPGSEADSGFNEPFNPRRSSVPSRAEEPPMACSNAQPAAGSSGGECCAKQTEPTVLPGELAAASAAGVSPHPPHLTKALAAQQRLQAHLTVRETILREEAAQLIQSAYVDWRSRREK